MPMGGEASKASTGFKCQMKPFPISRNHLGREASRLHGVLDREAFEASPGDAWSKSGVTPHGQASPAIRKTETGKAGLADAGFSLTVSPLPPVVPCVLPIGSAPSPALQVSKAETLSPGDPETGRYLGPSPLGSIAGCVERMNSIFSIIYTKAAFSILSAARHPDSLSKTERFTPMGTFDADIEDFLGNGPPQAASSRGAQRPRTRTKPSPPVPAKEAAQRPVDSESPESPSPLMGKVVTIDVNGLADLLGVHPRQIANFADDGKVVRLKHGEYDRNASIRTYIEHLRTVAAGRSQSSTLAVERQRLAKAQADAVEIKVAAARAELIPAKEIETQWATVLRDVRASMLALPSRIQQRLGILSAADVSIIDREIRDALTEAGNDRA